MASNNGFSTVVFAARLRGDQDAFLSVPQTLFHVLER
jgi:hypothetical protein